MDIQVEKKKFYQTKTFAGWCLLGVAIISLAFYGFSFRKHTLKIDPDRLIISEVKKGKFQESITVSGIVLPLSTIYLDALEGGRIEQIFVEDGAILKKGDPILQLSNTDLELSLINQETSVYNLLTQMQISRNAARQNTINRINQKTDVVNTYREAERVYNLNQKLFKRGVIARQDYEKSENEFEYQQKKLQLAEEVVNQDSVATKQEIRQLESSYHRTQKALELMRKKVNDLIVRAPIDGQLTSLDAQIGMSRNKGDRLGQIDVLDGYKVRTAIDEYYINRIYAGQEGVYTNQGSTIKLKIQKIYTQVQNGKFEVDMVFKNKVPEGIRRGLSLPLKISLSNEKESLIVNKGGFFQKTGGNWVFKINTDETKAVKVNTKLGSQNSDYYEVLEGLAPGDRVITSGYEGYDTYEELILK